MTNSMCIHMANLDTLWSWQSGNVYHNWREGVKFIIKARNLGLNCERDLLPIPLGPFPMHDRVFMLTAITLLMQSLDQPTHPPRNCCHLSFPTRLIVDPIWTGKSAESSEQGQGINVTAFCFWFSKRCYSCLLWPFFSGIWIAAGDGLSVWASLMESSPSLIAWDRHCFGLG